MAEQDIKQMVKDRYGKPALAVAPGKARAAPAAPAVAVIRRRPRT